MSFIKKIKLNRQLKQTIEQYADVTSRLKHEVRQCVTYKQYIKMHKEQGENVSTLESEFRSRLGVVKSLREQANVLRMNVHGIVADLSAEHGTESTAVEARISRAEAKQSAAEIMIDKEF